MTTPILVARTARASIELLPSVANRHGCITGATGTGKTVTLQRLAHEFSARGVPVFMADVKGDLSGIARPGRPSDKMAARLAERGIEVPPSEACPVTFWDVYGELGHPVRATVSDLGPLLLARLLGLNETQTGVLNLVFRIADDEGLLLLDMKDLRAMCAHVGENAKSYTTEYGNVSAASIGAIQRGLLAVEQQGGDRFFGEPMLDIDDLMQTVGGRGVVNLLAADRLMQAPKLYSTFLLWLLSELFERLPEVGDVEQPKIVFFFDEAHLLFDEAPKVLVDKVEQVVRLIRSKGVGVYFVTQNPLDIPDSVLAQLGNRVQHALRAFTPRDQKAVKTAAETMRPNPRIDAVKAIQELGIGEALVSLLDEHATPSITERGWIVPPGSQLGPITPEERRAVMAGSLVAGVYDETLDRDSAYERLTGKPAPTATRREAHDGGEGSTTVTSHVPEPSAAEAMKDELGGLFGSPAGRPAPRGMPDVETRDWRPGPSAPRPESAARRAPAETRAPTRRTDSLLETVAKSALRSMGTTVGREIVRGVLGSILGGRRR
ncbi:helicase HerA-like domain-containing protein [Derxia gummosa]|uniref:Helicase HerA-like domain-containing protein n=1 Tax=Derxia gummosa DSM 723 TaxID=1121388 RepID=A0A8B6X321_9BURK|nr:helicase HerA-like domain-containing protein [Derxia gummosa]